jgi:methionine-rich copper-binding protein CopC
MKRLPFGLLAAGLAAAATLLIATVASAHAPIRYITWDADSNPTRVIAATDNREMEATPGGFYLRVYNAAGARVDNGDTTISPDRLQLAVTLLPNLPSGTYRVDWLTTSTDGAVLSGSESLPLPGSFGEAPAAPEEMEEHADEGSMAEPISPPSAGDAGLAGRDGSDVNALASIALVVLMAGGVAFAYRRGS